MSTSLFIDNYLKLVHEKIVYFQNFSAWELEITVILWKYDDTLDSHENSNISCQCLQNSQITNKGPNRVNDVLSHIRAQKKISLLLTTPICYHPFEVIFWWNRSVKNATCFCLKSWTKKRIKKLVIFVLS